jgi:hypothetical protein
VVIRLNINEDLRMIIRVEISDVVAGSAIFHTLPYILTSKQSMKDRLQKGQIHLNSKQEEVGVDLVRSSLKPSSRNEFKTL